MNISAPSSTPDKTAFVIPLQPASDDIWRSKYQLRDYSANAIDASLDATFQRVARALADLESTPEKQRYWYQKFLWALEHGAIPAGRIISNAGAQAYKPATKECGLCVWGKKHPLPKSATAWTTTAMVKTITVSPVRLLRLLLRPLLRLRRIPCLPKPWMEGGRQRQNHQILVVVDAPLRHPSALPAPAWPALPVLTA